MKTHIAIAVIASAVVFGGGGYFVAEKVSKQDLRDLVGTVIYVSEETGEIIGMISASSTVLHEEAN